jgi:tetratricopeptide (TPR) repeat protein
MYGSSKDGSLQALQDATKRDPQNENVWMNLANAAEAKGDRVIWKDALQKLIYLCPSSSRYRFQLGQIMQEDQNLTEARRLFEQVLEITPVHPIARQHLAELNGVAVVKIVKKEPLRREDFIIAVPSPKMTEMPSELIAASLMLSEGMIEQLYGKQKSEEKTSLVDLSPSKRAGSDLEMLLPLRFASIKTI